MPSTIREIGVTSLTQIFCGVSRRRIRKRNGEETTKARNLRTNQKRNLELLKNPPPIQLRSSAFPPARSSRPALS